MHFFLVPPPCHVLRFILFCFHDTPDVCLQRFEIPRYSEEQALALYHKQALGLSPKALAVFKALHAWRDGVARDEDESPRLVCVFKCRQGGALRQPNNEGRSVDVLA